MAAQKVADFKAMAEAVECCFITTHNARHILCDVGASSTAFVVREKVFFCLARKHSPTRCVDAKSSEQRFSYANLNIDQEMFVS
jgi:hypothetical protein